VRQAEEGKIRFGPHQALLPAACRRRKNRISSAPLVFYASYGRLSSAKLRTEDIKPGQTGDLYLVPLSEQYGCSSLSPLPYS
jgi:hypothetical protein